MTDLTGKTIANTYKQLLRVGVSTNTGVSAGLTTIESGDGTDSSFQLATNSAKFTGTLVVDGATSIADNLHVDEKVCASAFYGDGSNISGVTATIAGNISVSNATVGGNLYVSGTATIVGATHLQAALSVGGAAQFGSTVTVSGAAQLQSTVTAVGAATFKSTVTVENVAALKNNVTVGGTFNVAGASGFTSKATFSNDVSVSGRLDVATSVCIGSVLDVEGVANFATNISVSGNANIVGNVTATFYYGDGSNLTNVKAEIGIVDNISVSGYVNIGGNLSVSGTLNVGGEVGIGTTSPAQFVQISEATSAGTTSLLVSNPNGTGGASAALKLGVSPEDDSVAKFAIIHERLAAYGGGDTYFCSNYATNTTEVTDADAVITIKGSTDNVGIGTTSPAYKLEVDGAAALSAASTETRNFGIGYGRTGNGYSYLDLVGDATYSTYGLRVLRGNTGANTGTSLTHRGTGNFSLNSFDAGSISLLTSNTERMRIDSSGNMLLGTSSATTDLAYSPKLKLSGSGPGLYFEETDTSQDYSITALGGKFYIRDATAVVPRLTIDSSGNVGIGTTSPSTKLQLTGSADSIIRLEDTATIGAVDRKVGGLEFYQNDASGGAGIGSSIEAYHVNISGDTDLRFAT